jgi:hypothetical protein
MTRPGHFPLIDCGLTRIMKKPPHSSTKGVNAPSHLGRGWGLGGLWNGVGG